LEGDFDAVRRANLPYRLGDLEIIVRRQDLEVFGNFLILLYRFEQLLGIYSFFTRHVRLKKFELLAQSLRTLFAQFELRALRNF